MTGTTMEPDRLHAYLDGQLTDAEAAQVGAWLAEHPHDRAMLADWRHQKDMLRSAFNPVLAEPLPPTLLARANGAGRGRALRVAAAVGWMVLGITLGTSSGLRWDWASGKADGDLAGLPRQAAIAYAVYTPEVRHPVEVGADQEAHLVAWLSKRLGIRLKAPDLLAEGFHLVGGRLITADNGPGALLMYEDSSGQRLTLYVSGGSQDGGTTAFRFAHEGPLGTFYWVDGHSAYALTGAISKARLLPIASAVYKQLSDEPHGN